MSPPNHVSHPLITPAHSSEYRTLCDLPVEILVKIVSRIKCLRWMVVSYSLVCPCLRAVVVEHLFSTKLVARKLESCDHLVSFLQANPNICHKIQILKLSGTTLDDSTMFKLAAMLPKLKNLELGRFVYLPPSADSVPQQESLGPSATERFPLDILYIRPFTFEHGSSISGLCNILSPFHIEKLVLSLWEGQNSECDASTPLDPKLLHRPLRIDELWIGPYPRKELDVQCIPFFINALAHAMEPGSLKKIVALLDSADAVSAIGNLLTRAGGGLKSLSIDVNAPHPVSERLGWEDPLDNHWQTLNLAACSQLEFIKFHIYCRVPADAPQPQHIPVLSLAGAGMLSQAPRTLRKVAIGLWGLSRVDTLTSKRTLHLRAFDEVLAADKFPVLEEVRIGVVLDSGLGEHAWRKVEAGLRKALPSLHSRGLLTVSGNP